MIAQYLIAKVFNKVIPGRLEMLASGDFKFAFIS